MEEKITAKTGFDVNIKIPALDDGMAIAKNFVDKLIMPTVEETGLLLKDFVTGWRLNNQIKILNKAKVICDRYNVNPKQISLKILVPFLDNAGLEEDEYLQNKWSLLLANMVDSKQNITNHVFPYLLTQISKDEFIFLEKNLTNRDLKIERLRLEIDLIKRLNEPQLTELSKKLDFIKAERTTISETSVSNGLDIPRLKEFDEVWSVEQEIKAIENDKRISAIIGEINRVKEVSLAGLKEYEVSNILRLGILRAEQIPISYENEVKLPDRGEYLIFDVDIDISEINYYFTQLGEKFIDACTEKKL